MSIPLFRIHFKFIPPSLGLRTEHLCPAAELIPHFAAGFAGMGSFSPNSQKWGLGGIWNIQL